MKMDTVATQNAELNYKILKYYFSNGRIYNYQ